MKGFLVAAILLLIGTFASGDEAKSTTSSRAPVYTDDVKSGCFRNSTLYPLDAVTQSPTERRQEQAEFKKWFDQQVRDGKIDTRDLASNYQRTMARAFESWRAATGTGRQSSAGQELAAQRPLCCFVSKATNDRIDKLECDIAHMKGLQGNKELKAQVLNDTLSRIGAYCNKIREINKRAPGLISSLLDLQGLGQDIDETFSWKVSQKNDPELEKLNKELADIRSGIFNSGHPKMMEILNSSPIVSGAAISGGNNILSCSDASLIAYDKLKNGKGYGGRPTESFDQILNGMISESQAELAKLKQATRGVKTPTSCNDAAFAENSAFRNSCASLMKECSGATMEKVKSAFKSLKYALGGEYNNEQCNPMYNSVLNKESVSSSTLFTKLLVDPETKNLFQDNARGQSDLYCYLKEKRGDDQSGYWSSLGSEVGQRFMRWGTPLALVTGLGSAAQALKLQRAAGIAHKSGQLAQSQAYLDKAAVEALKGSRRMLGLDLSSSAVGGGAAAFETYNSCATPGVVYNSLSYAQCDLESAGLDVSENLAAVSAVGQGGSKTYSTDCAKSVAAFALTSGAMAVSIRSSYRDYVASSSIVGEGMETEIKQLSAAKASREAAEVAEGKPVLAVTRNFDDSNILKFPQAERPLIRDLYGQAKKLNLAETDLSDFMNLMTDPSVSPELRQKFLERLKLADRGVLSKSIRDALEQARTRGCIAR
ncbi:MAG: hypothetical protein IT289_13370 [Oligoflexia bacterium]|nr:hypothetical protein [Oligoflexia bacterium]